MSNVLGAGGGNAWRFSYLWNYNEKYEDMAIKVGDKVIIEINNVDGNGT